jgi:integrase
MLQPKHERRVEKMRNGSSKQAEGRGGRRVRKFHKVNGVKTPVLKPDGTPDYYEYGAYVGKKEQARLTCEDPTLGQVIDDFQKSELYFKAKAKSTQYVYALNLARMKKLRDVPIKNITRPMLMETREGIAKGTGIGTARQWASAIGSLMTYAMDMGYIDQSPCVKMKRGLPKCNPLEAWTEDDLALAKPYVREPVRRVLVLAEYTGLRISDLVAMEWWQYDGWRIKVRPIKTKNHDPNKWLTLPCHPELKRELDAWKKEYDDAVRTGVNCGRSHFGKLVPPPTTILHTSYWTTWSVKGFESSLQRELLTRVPGFPSHRNELGNLVPDKSIHGLRKLAAVRLAQAGCSGKLIKAVGIGMVDLYTESFEQEQGAELALAKLIEHERKKGTDYQSLLAKIIDPERWEREREARLEARAATAPPLDPHFRREEDGAAYMREYRARRRRNGGKRLTDGSYSRARAAYLARKEQESGLGKLRLGHPRPRKNRPTADL